MALSGILEGGGGFWNISSVPPYIELAMSSADGSSADGDFVPSQPSTVILYPSRDEYSSKGDLAPLITVNDAKSIPPMNATPTKISK